MKRRRHGRKTAVIGSGQGIDVLSNGTVTSNVVGDNGQGGIVVGPRSLVTNNTSNDNGEDGIERSARTSASRACRELVEAALQK